MRGQRVPQMRVGGGGGGGGRAVLRASHVRVPTAAAAGSGHPRPHLVTQPPHPSQPPRRVLVPRAMMIQSAATMAAAVAQGAQLLLDPHPAPTDAADVIFVPETPEPPPPAPRRSTAVVTKHPVINVFAPDYDPTATAATRAHEQMRQRQRVLDKHARRQCVVDRREGIHRILGRLRFEDPMAGKRRWQVRDPEPHQCAPCHALTLILAPQIQPDVRQATPSPVSSLTRVIAAPGPALTMLFSTLFSTGRQRKVLRLLAKQQLEAEGTAPHGITALAEMAAPHPPAAAPAGWLGPIGQTVAWGISMVKRYRTNAGRRENELRGHASGLSSPAARAPLCVCVVPGHFSRIRRPRATPPHPSPQRAASARASTATSRSGRPGRRGTPTCPPASLANPPCRCSTVANENGQSSPALAAKGSQLGSVCRSHSRMSATD